MMNKKKIIGVLYNIYDKREVVDDYDEIVKDLSGIKINSIVNYLVYHDKDYDEDDVNMMGIIIKILQDIYNNSDVNPPITDELYDQLYAAMLSAGDTNIVGSDVGSDKIIVPHRYPDLRGTLDKVHFFTNIEKGKDKRKSIDDWINRSESKLGKGLDFDTGDITVFPKFDGVSIVFECDKNGNVIKALTRGNTEKNEACEVRILSGLKFKPYPDWRDQEFGIKTEVVMPFNKFEKFCKKYGQFKSPRSAVSSIINSNEPKIDFLKYIVVVPLRMQNAVTGEIIIHPDAYSVYPNTKANLCKPDWVNTLKETCEGIHNYMSMIMEIPTDGIVLHMNDEETQRILGRDDAINKYEVAYKFPPVGVKTHIIDVDFSIGVLGSITPVAKIEPVVMDGNTIKSVSLGSIDRFESLSLRYGDEVIIKYEIIPYLTKDLSCESNLDSELIATPTTCRYCGEDLVSDPILRCANDECPCRMIGKIVNYLNKMDIMNISEGIVTSLFNIGILKSIEDLYKLNNHRNTIIGMGGFGDKLYEKILKGIKARKKVYDYILLGSLGIPNIGRKMFKRILNIYYIDELIEICNDAQLNKLIEIRGIQEKTASAIMVGILSNEDLIAFLVNELDIIRTKGKEDESSISVLFTKVRDEEFARYLTDKGVDVASSYTKNVSIVIVPSLSVTSTKTDKAKADGKEIITLEDAYKRFDYAK